MFSAQLSDLGRAQHWIA